MASAVRGIVRELDPELPVYNVRTLTAHVETNLLFRRIPARMFAVLGPMLLVLAAIGIYAVVAYTVSQRTTEIGVRLALGATPRGVVAQFVRESLLVIGVGALAGWAIALSAVIVLRGAMDVRDLRRRAGAADGRGRECLLAVSAPRRTLRSDGRAAPAIGGSMGCTEGTERTKKTRHEGTKTNEDERRQRAGLSPSAAGRTALRAVGWA